MADPTKRTGTVEPFMRADGAIYFKARIAHEDGYRERVDIPKKHQTAAGGLSAKERAALYAQALQEREDQTGERFKARQARLVDRGPTMDDYARGVFDRRAAEGKSSVPKERRIWKARVSPMLGAEPMATVPKDKVEAFREYLDAEVRLRIKTGDKLQGISGKTALIIWTLVRTICKEAFNSRDRSLRVRADDPTHGVLPPLKTRSREKTFLYPVEFAQLMACGEVPLEWRETYAVGAYLYLRPGEQRALTVERIDLEAGIVEVLEAFDEEGDKVKETKTKKGRRKVPIPPALAPLLKRILDRSAPGALVSPLLAGVADNKRAILFREHLALAKLTRPRLLEDTATTVMVNFRSLRDSGITWEALARTPVDRIQARAGHEDIATTIGYIKLVEDLHGKLGEPFGPLPFAPPSLSNEPSKDPLSVRNEGSGCWTRTPDERQLASDSRQLAEGSCAIDLTRVDVSAHQSAPGCPTELSSEEALVEALQRASAAGEWEVVSRLARELEARRASKADQTLPEYVRDRVLEAKASALAGDEASTLAPLAKAAQALASGKVPAAGGDP